jgi:hypothetical protein
MFQQQQSTNGLLLFKHVENLCAAGIIALTGVD